MILKMMSRRNPASLTHTLNYIAREEAFGDIPPILHNLRTESPYDIDGISKEILTNEAYRKIQKGRLYFFHNIISLGRGDKLTITSAMMQAIAYKYLELRGDLQAYVVVHQDAEHVHVHIVEGATYYFQDRSTGLRKHELHALKLEMETFIKEKFPQLTHSQVQHGSGKPYDKQGYYQLEKRTGHSERGMLTELVHKAYTRASSLTQFLEILMNHGYAHYERNSDGTATGLVSPSGRKYRFKTLAIPPQHIMQLETKPEKDHHQKLLDQLRNLRTPNNIERER